ncbi:MAG: arylsulfatase [Planctomycetaceae bacterium]|nr:arylsulfatase [Planctomycetaceae bacterium]
MEFVMRKTDLVFLLLALCAGLFVVADRAEARQPNIIFIMADDLGYHELGCYGQKWIKTPNIDRIAAEGIKFTQFYSGQAVCAPARCVLMTGKHTGHSYIRNNGNPKHLQHLAPKYGWEFPGQFPIPDEELTVAEILKKEGYATAACGKWGLGHFGTSGDPNKQGFDLFYGFNCQVHAHNHYPKFLWRNGKKEILPGNDRTLNGETYSQDKFTEVALDFIKEKQDQPFFLYLPFAIPHLSIQVTEESLNEYKGKIPEEDYKHRGYLEHPFPRAGYAAMVTHMDRDVGKVMSLVKELGLDDDTIVFFTSDNGPTYDRLGGSDSDFFESAGDFKGLKGSLYEGGIRVPLVARWPGKIVPGTISHHQAAFWDVLPTLCDIAGTKKPDDIDGISLAPTLFGNPDQQANHEYLYWEFPAYGGQQAVRMGPWKGIRQNMFKGNFHIELYNLEDDIGETTDVSSEHPEIVKQIEQIMLTAREPAEVLPFKQLDEWQAKQRKAN